MASKTATKSRILIIGSGDTKINELRYLRDQIVSQPDAEVYFIDTRTTISDDTGRIVIAGMNYIDQETLLKQMPLLNAGQNDDRIEKFRALDRSQRTNVIIQGAIDSVRYLVEDARSSWRPNGIIAAGGSSNTTLAAEVMRSLPLGFPKLIVSTIASGDTGPIIGECDITLMYSIVDVAGLNSLLKGVLSNAAGAIVGMARSYQARARTSSDDATPKKLRIGITMFGVTTPCVTHIQRLLASGEYPDFGELYVFHATGHGGRAMERLIRDEKLDAVIDLTTTEIADHIVGGIMSSGPDRLNAAAERGIPVVLSFGACDMVNFGPLATVPEKFRSSDEGRELHEHNSAVTLMRTSKSECEQIGAFIAEKLSRSKRPKMVEVLIPEKGVSALSTVDGAFHDPDADEALFRATEDGLKSSAADIVVRRIDQDVNSEPFARQVLSALSRVLFLNLRSPA